MRKKVNDVEVDQIDEYKIDTMINYYFVEQYELWFSSLEPTTFFHRQHAVC